MKKRTLICMAVLMTAMVAFCFGCTKKDSDVAEAEPLVVSSTEEFIEAIEPGANIVFKKGDYNLSEELEEIADDNLKKWNNSHDYVTIEDTGDGLQLIIEDVEGISIAGEDGKDIELVADSAYVDVLTFKNCSSVSLTNMTLGHDVEKGSCIGDVLQFEDCEEVLLTELDIYGCGAYGIYAENSNFIDVESCIIRECTYGVMWYDSCDEFLFNKCEMYGTDGSTLFEVTGSSGTFKKCNIYDNNYVYTLISEYKSNDITFNDCSFGYRESVYFDFGNKLSGEGYKLDSKCSFDDENSLEVTVDNVKDFIDAIAPGAVITLEPGTYNLSDYFDEMTEDEIDSFNSSNTYVCISPVYDGYQLDIYFTDGITIKASEGYGCESTEIITDPRYATVLAFYYTSGINISGVTVGHTETGYCIGDVLGFEDCSDVNISSCDLYGCGVNGIYTYDTTNLDVQNSCIHDCSGSGLYTMYPDGTYYFYNCSFIDSNGMKIGNEYGTAEYTFEECIFGQYESNVIAFADDVVLIDCDVMDPTGYPDYSDSYFDPLVVLTDMDLDELIGDDYWWTGYKYSDYVDGNTVYLPEDPDLGITGDEWIVFYGDNTGIIMEDVTEYSFTWEYDLANDCVSIAIDFTAAVIEADIYMYLEEDYGGYVIRLVMEEKSEVWYY